MNPADLFTKHLSSRDRINQLVKLFNCEFRDGRAESAPLLRKQKSTAQGGTVAVATQYDKRKPNDEHEDGTTTTTHQQRQPSSSIREEDEHPAHDPSYLPHEYPENEIDELFPAAVAVGGEDREDSCICSMPECTRCFPEVKMPYAAGAEAW